jgi:hypothetical protein
MRTLATLVLAVALLALPACKDDPVSPRTGTVVFTADAACPNGTVELSLDGEVKGQFAMVPNATVQSFTIAEGAHTAGARQIGGAGLVWEDTDFTLQANTTFTIDMLCG